MVRAETQLYCFTMAKIHFSIWICSTRHVTFTLITIETGRIISSPGFWYNWVPILSIDGSSLLDFIQQIIQEKYNGPPSQLLSISFYPFFFAVFLLHLLLPPSSTCLNIDTEAHDMLRGYLTDSLATLPTRLAIFRVSDTSISVPLRMKAEFDWVQCAGSSYVRGVVCFWH